MSLPKVRARTRIKAQAAIQVTGTFTRIRRHRFLWAGEPCHTLSLVNGMSWTSAQGCPSARYLCVVTTVCGHQISFHVCPLLAQGLGGGLLRLSAPLGGEPEQRPSRLTSQHADLVRRRDRSQSYLPGWGWHLYCEEPDDKPLQL